MPPSGYSYDQAEAVSEFFASCVRALVSENRGMRTASEAIKREIASISADLKEGHRPAFEHHLLELTKVFYTELLSECPSTFDDLPAHAEGRLDEVRSRILGIHVAA